jgi:hypothetical protein
VVWHPPVPDAVAEQAAGVETEPVPGTMVQLHDSERHTALAGKCIETTDDLVAYLDGRLYWSPLDAF